MVFLLRNKQPLENNDLEIFCMVDPKIVANLLNGSEMFSSVLRLIICWLLLTNNFYIYNLTLFKYIAPNQFGKLSNLKVQ